MRTLRATVARRRLQYVLLLTVAVAVIGAAGMLAFEPAGPDGKGFDGYLSALWWTTMVLTTMGSEYWPRTAEGRILCVALAVYAFAVFGYVTASIATLLVGRDAESDAAAGARSRAMEQEVRALARELAALRVELSASRGDSERAADGETAAPTH
jgi:voltage-gated potassium channel